MAPRRKYTSEEEQELALTSVGENDDMPSEEDFESEYDEDGDVEELNFDDEDFGDSEYDEDYGTDSYSDID